jgi:hypothetical protein
MRNGWSPLRERHFQNGGRVLGAYHRCQAEAKRRHVHRWWKLTQGPPNRRKVVPIFRLFPLELDAMQAVWRTFASQQFVIR